MRRASSLAVLAFLLLALGLTAAPPAAALEETRPARRLSDQELEGLMVALDREYHLQAVYGRALAEYGAGEPFLTAARVQRARVEALQTVYRNHGLAVPANPWIERLRPFASREQACVAALRGELGLAGLLERLDEATERSDLSSAYGTAREPGTWRTALRDCALDASVEEAVAAAR